MANTSLVSVGCQTIGSRLAVGSELAVGAAWEPARMDNLMSFSEGADPSKQRKSKSNRWSGTSNSDGSSDKAAPAAAGASAISDIAAGLKRFELEQSRVKKAAPLPAAKNAAAPAVQAPAALAPASLTLTIFSA